MAVNAEFVKELLDSRRTVASEQERTHERSFMVRLLADPLVYGPGSINARLGETADGVKVPVVGEVHPDDAFARVIDVSADTMGDLRTYRVDVSYSTRSRFAGFTFTGSSEEQDFQLDNPLARPWVWSFGVRLVEKPVERAYRVTDLGFGGEVGSVLHPMSEEVLNSARQPYDPPMLEDDYIITMSVTRYEPSTSFTPLKCLAWSGVLNATAWEMSTNIVWPKWTAKCTGISATTEYTAGQYWWQVTYNIEFKWDDWTRSVLDAGWSYIENNQRIAATDDGGEPAAYPILLNGVGGKLAQGGTPVYRRYLTKRTRDFATLFNY